jgi:hypothetical protein
MATDAEVTAAINTHLNVVDPHPIYLTQLEGDARYRQSATSLTDADIPPAVARDAEVTAAINAHLNAFDPHPMYLTQLEGDARYSAKYHYSGTTNEAQGGSLVIPHGLVFAKIRTVSGLLEHSNGLSIKEGHEMSAGYLFNLSLSTTSIFVGNVPSKSFNILSKPIKITIEALA